MVKVNKIIPVAGTVAVLFLFLLIWWYVLNGY